MKTNRLILLLFILLPAYVLAGNRFQELYTNIHQFISQQKAEVGVAIIADGKDTVTIENNRRYPLMSVFKLHQALAVGDYCKKHQISFDTLLTVDSTDLQPNTYSPLRDRYPHGGRFSLKQLMEYTLHLSDNNACDILFKFTGGPAVTDRYIRNLGINDFSIQYTEDDMHRDLNLGYENWSTPLATAEVIEALLTRTLFDKPHQEFIKEALVTCQTGTSRIVHPLQDKQVTVGHKTGTATATHRDNSLPLTMPDLYSSLMVTAIPSSFLSKTHRKAWRIRKPLSHKFLKWFIRPSPTPDKLLSPADKPFSSQEPRYSASNHTDEVLPISLPYSIHSDEYGCGSPA